MFWSKLVETTKSNQSVKDTMTWVFTEEISILMKRWKFISILWLENQKKMTRMLVLCIDEWQTLCGLCV